MNSTGWNGLTPRVRVGVANAAGYFNKESGVVHVELDGIFHAIRISRGFWKARPELHGKLFKTG